jgi:hypothetical protein
VAVHGVTDPRYDETSWWRSRDGIKGWLFGWLDLAYAWKVGEQRVIPPRCSMEEYQALFDKNLGEVP